jgi:hypothetical protein
MRTTVTLDPDVQALLKKTMRERGISFKEALNDGIRKSYGATRRKTPAKAFRTPAFDLQFYPGVNLVKALQLAGELENEEIMRKMMLGK